MKRKGFTLVELLIVIVVLGVIAAMMMLSSTETIATAKAAKVIANLHTLRKAVEQWYADNREKIGRDGMVTIKGKSQPVQQWTDKELQLSRYIDNIEHSDIHIHMETKKDDNTGNYNTNLTEGSYGICDGGRVFVWNEGTKKWEQTEFHRNAWYVGYRFKEGEEKVREKIKGRMESTGVSFGTADAHLDTYNDNSAAVWLRVF